MKISRQFLLDSPSRPIIPAKSDTKDDETKWYNKIYFSYDTKGLVKHKINNDLKMEETYHPGITQNVSLSSPQKILKWFTINPSLDAHISAFNGYFDTTVYGKDTIYNNDTLIYTLHSPFKDDQYKNYKFAAADTFFNQYGMVDSIVMKRVKSIVKDRLKETKDILAYTSWWKTQVELSTVLYGIIPMHIFNFSGLRHTITPSVSYSFVPEHKLDKKFYDIGIPYERGHKQQQIINLSLNNSFDGKIIKSTKKDEKPSEIKFPLLSVNLSTSYDFEAETRKWSDLNLNASTSIKMVRLSYQSSFWLYDEKNQISLPIMRNLNFSLSTGSLGAKGSFWGGNILELDSLNTQYNAENKSEKSGPQQWEFSFSPAYSFSMSRSSPTQMFIPDKKYSLNASASFNFSPNWSLSWSGDYNFTDNQWVRNSINIRCDLECWDMHFQWRPERLNPGYYFLVNIKKIPEIKWEQKK